MEKINLTLEYDRESDAAFLCFGKDINVDVHSTDSFEIEGQLKFGIVNIDFSNSKRILGIEILDASKILPKEILKK